MRHSLGAGVGNASVRSVATFVRGGVVLAGGWKVAQPQAVVMRRRTRAAGGAKFMCGSFGDLRERRRIE
jgi:hypothetical protein